MPVDQPCVSANVLCLGMQLTESLKGKAGEVVYYPTDMSDPTAIDALAKKVLDVHGGIDILVTMSSLLFRSRFL